jgi:hypothetical protein
MEHSVKFHDLSMRRVGIDIMVTAHPESQCSQD